MINYDGKQYREIDTDLKLKKEIEDLMDLDHSELVGYYKNNGNTRLLFKCKEYNEYYTKSKSKFKGSKKTEGNRKCPYCQMGKNNVYCKSSFIKRLNELYPGEYSYTENSIWGGNNHTHIELKHKCGIVDTYNPTSLLQGKSTCNCQNNRITKDKFYKLMEEQGVRDEYEIIGEVKNNSDKVEMIHKPCGKTLFISYSNFKGNTKHPNGAKCYDCYLKSITKQDEDFKKELFDLYNGEVESLEEYKTNDIPIQFKCNKCGYDNWFSTPNNMLTGKSHCPKCTSKRTESEAEKFIYNYLKNNKINFKDKVKLQNCRYKRQLEIDFIINNNIYLEFDGSQHFYSSGYMNGKKIDFETGQKRDSIKTQYCIDNNLTHIRIPYTEEKNLESILDSIIDGSYISNKNIYIIQEGNLINNLDCYEYLNVKYNDGE